MANRAGTEIRALVWKEWLQLRRNRAALATALVLPAGMLFALPAGQILAFRNETALPPGHALAPGLLPDALSALASDPRALVRAALPLLVALGGLLAPAVTATHTLIAERESRTLELLAALPVRVGQVLWAKLLTIALVAGGASTLMVLADAGLMLATGFATGAYAAALLALVLASLAYSAASALLTALLSRDFRTANNVNGMLLAPTLALAVGLLGGAPGEPGRIALLAGVLALAAAAATVVAVKVVTFERLLR